ncbi:MAG: hypothetical protein V3W44_10940 [Dehalococcoidales bacterium]
MAKGVRQKCEALMKNGERCKHNALKGQQFCGTKSHQEQGEGPATLTLPSTPVYAHTKGGPGAYTEDNFSPHFAEIIEMCRAERADPDEKSGMLAQWARIQLDAVSRAMEDLRLRDGLGTGVTHVFNLIHPGDKPPMPTEDETAPVEAVRGSEKEMN